MPSMFAVTKGGMLMTIIKAICTQTDHSKKKFAMIVYLLSDSSLKH